MNTKITFSKAKHYICWASDTCHVQGTSQFCVFVYWGGGKKEPSYLIPNFLFQEGEERLGKCSAQVFFRNEKPRPTINITCTRFMEKSKRQQEDYLLYKHMQLLKDPLDVVSIPGMDRQIWTVSVRNAWNYEVLKKNDHLSFIPQMAL